MGITTRVKGDMAEKKPFNFALFWDKYGTFYPRDYSRHLWHAVIGVLPHHQQHHADFCPELGNGADRDGRILCHPCRGY